MNLYVPITQRVTQRIEIIFWDFVINTLTHSEFVRRLLPRVYHFLEPKAAREALILVMIASFAGFICGFLINLYILAR